MKVSSLFSFRNLWIPAAYIVGFFGIFCFFTFITNDKITGLKWMITSMIVCVAHWWCNYKNFRLLKFLIFALKHKKSEVILFSFLIAILIFSMNILYSISLELNQEFVSEGTADIFRKVISTNNNVKYTIGHLFKHIQCLIIVGLEFLTSWGAFEVLKDINFSFKDRN